MAHQHVEQRKTHDDDDSHIGWVSVKKKKKKKRLALRDLEWWGPWPRTPCLREKLHLIDELRVCKFGVS